MRSIEHIPVVEGATEKFKLTESRRQQLTEWLETEYAFAYSARQAYDRTMVENLRQYEGVAQQSVKQYPYEGAPNYEFNVSAIAVDTIHSQTIDLLFAIAPMCKALAVDSRYEKAEQPMQRFINLGTAGEWNVRPAATSFVLNTVKHGTGFLYVPYEEKVKRTDIRKIIERGPRIKSIPTEDVFAPGGVENIVDADWLGIRTFITQGELNEYVQFKGWSADFAKTAPRHSRVRNVRERYGKTTSHAGRKGTFQMYEVLRVYANVPIDGEDTDLLIYYDPNGHHIYKATYMPYDRWPFTSARYQLREHLLYGLGVPEMSRQFQQGVTDCMNNFLANSFLANMRGFKGPHGATGTGDSIKMRPGKYYGFPMPDQVEIFQLADVYPSSLAAVQSLLQFAERRTGVNDVSSPQSGSTLGNRTPGITALSVMQQANKRFVSAFDEMRLGLQGAVKHCLYRYQERLLAGDTDVEDYILKQLGQSDGTEVINVLRDEEFDNSMKIELSASDATANRMQDRQDSIALGNFVLPIYEKLLQALTVASTQGISEEVRSAALKTVNATNEIIRRTVNTFDQVRNPEKFVLDLQDEINAAPAPPEPGLEGILGALGMGRGAQGPGAGPGVAIPGGGQANGGPVVQGPGQGA